MCKKELYQIVQKECCLYHRPVPELYIFYYFLMYVQELHVSG